MLASDRSACARHANLLPPAFVEGEQIPLHARGKITQDGLRCRMDVQRRSDQIQPWRQRRKLNAAKVPVTLKLAQPRLRIGRLQVVLAHANPVIETLQGEVQVVVHLQLDHR